MVELPENINYNKYFGKSGMNTKVFGPRLWDFLFISILGHYPVDIDPSNPEHLQIKRAYRQMIQNLRFVLPCIFCRESFKGFLKVLPLKDYLIGRIELFYWLYLAKDLVNKKLIAQEESCFVTGKKRLKKEYSKGELSKSEYNSKLKAFKKDTFKTVASPPFELVLEKYEPFRARCSKTTKTCSKPLRGK